MKNVLKSVGRMRFLCRFFPHKIRWVGEEVKCVRCKRYASDIIQSNERADFENS